MQSVSSVPAMGHKCIKSQLYQFLLKLMSNSEVEDFQECSDQLEEAVCKESPPKSPIIFLHAITGSKGHNTLRVAARAGSVWDIILIDSSSTHNFIDAKLMHKLSLPVLQWDQLKVAVANGNCLFTRGVCKGVSSVAVSFRRYHLEFWLFNHTIVVKGEPCIIHGIVPGSIVEESMSSAHKCFTAIGQELGPYALVISSPTQIMEKMIHEMLQGGIIRDNNSSFASSIVMVKKKDRSWRLCVDYRQLNQHPIKDKLPIPIINEFLDELGEAKFPRSYELSLQDLAEEISVGYYGRFTRQYGSLAKPLIDLLKKSGWNASGFGVGAVLQQPGKLVAFFRKDLGVKHRALSIYKKEMLVVLLAIRKWHAYLVEMHFKIKTNHQSLKGHSGIHTSRKLFASLVYWKGLTPDVKYWTKECLKLFKRAGTKLLLSTTYHPQMDGQTELTPYEALDGQPLPQHMPYLAEVSPIAVVDRSLQAHEAARKMLKFHLKRAWTRIKQQQTIRRVLNQKLSSKYFCHFPMVKKLKKHIRTAPAQIQLPLMDDHRAMKKEPVRIFIRKGTKQQLKSRWNGWMHSLKMLLGNLCNNFRLVCLILILEDKDLFWRVVFVTG
ncbi:Retrovirus-related Pol polyprotein from transposon 17.6 [Gossypium australe]|uniref:Retrovirus-related Pol polyprotein from transposon 17.6 n=1 Tax=Gossypium australe TaxID=47621 RepID=A0A5B6VVL7_9ROSI|nr:Retrovirus-related Pol polyprotein from transposon 17.6 [Gossypium australe]